ncbi:DUF262 domain-containing HNH endonuclease family protein [Prevotella copri]|jgi:hypothetical protein|uniref:DUF262 domain-containing HNH endonuclease family protein n=1 Tax=Segatella copri TaxID=165179 RepID=A0AAW5IU97_9BACT|nr:DUF262 domain-containing protein [Segatella copri]MCP9553667.1 DUF262 domain-containing HNH endonuclease family protein [Segatella copri]MCP9574196.1 DUF262 domain-containing HNH endonuclease family protein [Segatella copri]MCP9577061.1 DUF262 domain-containing HNH endonuclease family protein [Segatella copri]MCP9579938.1 DUF262 domain-containing HNH endonuclease family protein [Segatella copri]MCP9582855.1 DUF262 domain-containing HNH endonuclease family protein [Segatella copri]
MNTYRYTPEKIVEEKLIFSIPLYQRLFSWGEEQVKGLLYDLKNHFDPDLDNGTPYYLGMLSCIKSGNHYDLIDGQQRFTVMILLAIVLRNYYEKWNGFLDGGKRLRFMSRTKDNEYLTAVINRQVEILDPNRKMEDGKKIIFDFMVSQFSSDDMRESFAKSAYTRMSFFFSELPLSYASNPASLNKYFEAMNAGGKGLEQHEILKVKLMQGEENKVHLTQIWNAVCDLNRPVIKRNEKDLEEGYRSKYMQAIELCRNHRFNEAFELCESSYDTEDNNEIGDIEAKQQDFRQSFIETGERSFITFPEFLMMVIDIYLNLSGSYSFYRKELLKIYEAHPIPDKQDFYNQLLFYRLLLDYYIVYKEGDENTNKYDIVFKEGASAEALKQYQSMLYVSQSPFYNWLKPVLERLHNETVRDTDELLLWIKEIDNSLHPLPRDVNEMTYDKGIDRYWFWRLDYYLWERKEDYFKTEEEKQIVEEYVFRANRSIEHLHPQHQENNDIWGDDDIHSFGNLAMISQSFNSQQSDDPVTVKFARIKDQAHNHTLQSIKMYLMYLDAEKSPLGWKVDIKNKHQDKMYDLLKKSYPDVSCSKNRNML